MKRILIALALLLHASLAAAQYPARSLRVIVPTPAGGTADVIARLLGERMAPALGQSWVVENRAGASGMIGSEIVAKAPPDGHTLLVFSNTFIMMPALFPNIGFDIFRDIAPVGLIASTPNVLVIHVDRGIRSLREFIDLAKRTPGGIDYGSPAVGSAAHLTVELFKRTAGISMNHIPFKGPQQAMAETVADRVPVTIAGVSNALAQVRAGKIVALAVADSRRAAVFPDVPTFTEAGVAGVDLSVWFGFFTTGGTPPAAIERLNAELNSALKSPLVSERLSQLGFQPLGGTPLQFQSLMQRERPVYAKLIQETGVKAD